MKWLAPFILSATLAWPQALPACTPYQREHWPVVDKNTVVEGRTILIHQEPGGTRRCGEVKRDETKPSQTQPKKGKKP